MQKTFCRAIQDFEGELAKRSTAWYSDEWIDHNLDKPADHFDDSLIRWRRLYRSARTLVSRATQPIESRFKHDGGFR